MDGPTTTATSTASSASPPAPDSQDQTADIQEQLQNTPISSEQNKATTTSTTLLQLCPEILDNIIDHLEPEDVICLALSCHKLRDAIASKTHKTLKQICPDKLRWLQEWQQIRDGVAFHSHCLRFSIDLRPRQRPDGSMRFIKTALLERLETWFGGGWCFCGRCRRYVPVCQCDTCQAEGEDEWRARVNEEYD